LIFFFHFFPLAFICFWQKKKPAASVKAATGALFAIFKLWRVPAGSRFKNDINNAKPEKRNYDETFNIIDVHQAVQETSKFICEKYFRYSFINKK